jgi:Glucose / Sorbosone dehydrogenase
VCSVSSLSGLEEYQPFRGWSGRPGAPAAEIRGDQVTHQEVLFSEFGRVRDLVQGPDGYLYVALQSPTGVLYACMLLCLVTGNIVVNAGSPLFLTP